MDYLHELAEIYDSGGTNNRYILADLKAIERRLTREPNRDASVRHALVQCGGKSILWVDDVVAVLEARGGTAHVSVITQEVVARRKAAGRSVTRCSESTVRYTLHAHSSDAAKFWYEGVNTRVIFKREYALGPG